MGLWMLRVSGEFLQRSCLQLLTKEITCTLGLCLELTLYIVTHSKFRCLQHTEFTSGQSRPENSRYTPFKPYGIAIRLIFVFLVSLLRSLPTHHDCLIFRMAQSLCTTPNPLPSRLLSSKPLGAFTREWEVFRRSELGVCECQQSDCGSFHSEKDP